MTPSKKTQTDPWYEWVSTHSKELEPLIGKFVVLHLEYGILDSDKDSEALITRFYKTCKTETRFKPEDTYFFYHGAVFPMIIGPCGTDP